MSKELISVWLSKEDIDLILDWYYSELLLGPEGSTPKEPELITRLKRYVQEKKEA